MTDLQKKIKAAFDLVKKIPVTEDDVDRMAAARVLLNDAFRMAGAVEKEQTPREAERLESPEEVKTDG